MDFLCPGTEDLDQALSQICESDLLLSWTAEPLAGPMAAVDPFITKCPALKEADWEMKKPAIERFYLTENQTLNATIICMREQYGFAATEKMYKRHFRLWGWHKYTTKSAQADRQPKDCGPVPASDVPTGDYEPPRKKARVQEDLVDSSKALSTPSTLVPLNLKTFKQKAVMVTSMNQLLDSHASTVTPASASCSSSRYRLLKSSSSPRLLDGLYEALNTLDHDRKLGWQAIERIFDQIQHHIGGNDIMSFVDLCMLIPRALLFSRHGRALGLYLSRLEKTLQESNTQGPLTDVTRVLQDTYRPQDESGLLELLVFGSSVFAAALVEKYGKEDRKSLLATWDSLRLEGQLNPTLATTWLQQWGLLHQECMSLFGRHGLLTLNLEEDISGLLQPSRLYPQAVCPEEIQGLINSVRRRLFLIPSQDSGRACFEDDGSLFF